MYFNIKVIECFIYFLIPIQIKAVLNKHDKSFFGWDVDTYDWSSHPCRRTCNPYEPPKTCYYVFVTEIYSTMSKACYDCPRNITDCYRSHCIPADGVQKTVYVVNRQLPGPKIEVCQNDKIVVEVRNKMLSDSVTIHWHGIRQTGTPYMDGVPYVTQCPILPGQRFQYAFKAGIQGTYFWHSHIGHQRADGLFGALIIHPQVSKNVHEKLYDYDNQLMILNEWTHLDGSGIQTKINHLNNTRFIDTILVNGRGRFFNSGNDESMKTPLAVFEVKKDKRYRFRVIDTGSEDCPMEMSIDNHTMQVISLDSNDIQPVEVDVISFWPGERIDFILKADQKPGNYFIRYRGFTSCRQKEGRAGIFQVALLHYDSEPLEEPQSQFDWNLLTDKNRVMNSFSTESQVQSSIDIPSLKAMAPNDEAVSGRVDQQIYITFDSNRVDNFYFHRKHLYGFYQVPTEKRQSTVQLNHITLKLPSFPLLSQTELIKPGSFCNSSSVSPSCKTEFCDCTHVLQIKLNNVVEIVFVNEGNNLPAGHPLHLHGHFFRVVAADRVKDGRATVEKVKQLDREGKVKRKLDHAPIKDTMKVPINGYTIVRFHANNPGYWLLHCHYDSHLSNGMALVVKVGEHSNFAPRPKNFPTCGDYVPDDHFNT